jgi:hypothetical protein
MANARNLKTIQDLFGTVTKHGYDQPLAPMWRNGRRNGLKIRSREGVWVRIPSSAPSEKRFYEEKLIRDRQSSRYERLRTKKHKNEVYLPSVRQAQLTGVGNFH